jgi:ribosomal protein L10
MTDKQIDYLKQLMRDHCMIAWFDGENYREIINIVKKMVDDGSDIEEMAGVFNDGKYIDLYNVNEFDMVTIHTASIFPSYSKTNG